MPPHHPPLPSARRTARSPRTPPPRTLQPSTAHTRPGGDSGLGSRGAPGLAWGSPSPLPGGRAAPGASVAHGDPRGSAPAPRAARAECGGFCSRDPSSPFLGKQPKGRADARDAQASGWLWVSPTPPISRNLHKRETQKCSKFACGRRCATPPPAPARATRRSGRGREWGAGRGGETGPGRRREARGAPGSRAVPGPERKPRARISDPGSGDAAFSAFPPRAPFPFPHLDASRLPQPPLAR